LQCSLAAFLQIATSRLAGWPFGLGFAGAGSGTADASATGMIDLLLVLSTAAFFALSWGYARLCEKL
jgi:hypothetical protein